ncbi:hypothetical protein Avbf_17066 [Armadillidium vulgare]|nr:hypothetical protein Avbf_17066 [Armadillidium vulgare]
MNVSLLLKNLSITRQGTVDLMTTVLRILRTEQLDPSHSCELACFYFIVDDILNNHCVMVINQQKYLEKLLLNMFNECVKCNNEIAVQYLWNFYVSKIRSVNCILREVLLISVPSSLHINITMFLLFQ